MALILETGAGVAGANTYATVAQYRAYWTERGNAVAAGTTPVILDAVIETLLIKATQYMTATFRLRWKGRRLTKAQGLEWPRVDVYLDGTGESVWIPGLGTRRDGFLVDSNEIPRPLLDAEIELAWKANSVDLLTDIKATQSSIRAETVGPISVEYFEGKAQQTTYELVERILSALLQSTGGEIPLERG